MGIRLRIGGLKIGSSSSGYWTQLFNDTPDGGTTYLRKVVRMQGVNEIYSVDIRLTESPGFNGVENIDFVSIYSNEIWTQDVFDRANGAVGNDWVGSTWTIVDGKVINTPIEGTEKLTAGSGAFEGTYVAGLAPGWTKVGTPTLSEEVGVTGKAQGITDGTTGNSVTRSALYVSNTWYKLAGWAKLVSGPQYAYFRLLTGLIPASDSVLRVSSTIFSKLLYTYRSLLDNYSSLTLYSPAGTLCAYDDISVKPLTTSELFLSRTCSYVDKLRVRVEIKVTDRAEGGIFMCMDDVANPLNYVYAIVRDNYKFRSGDVTLYKCVNGTHTLLKTGTVITADFRSLEIVRKNSTTVAVYYDNTQVSTDATIDDASIVDNTNVGLFSTDVGNQFKNFEAVHIETQKHVPSGTLLYTFVEASDIHVGTVGAWNAGELDALVTQFNTINPDATLLLGDITDHGLQTEKDTFDASFDNLTSTKIELEGNHDANAGLDLFPHNFVYNIGDFTLIGFHTVQPNEIGPNGQIEAAELIWLEAQMIAATGKIILFSHIPVWNPLIDEAGVVRFHIESGYGQEELMALCEEYGVKVVYSGHNHLNGGEYNVQNGVAYYTGMDCQSLYHGFQVLKFYSDRINLMRYNARTPFTQYGDNMGINTWF